MILLLGASGYIGSAVRKELDHRVIEWTQPMVSHELYTSFKWLRGALEAKRHDLVFNCAAFIPGVVDNCEDHKAETLHGNLLFPAALANACAVTDTPLLHVSTGCLFNGDNGGTGFRESDTPHLSFRTKCGVYVGAKQLAEEVVGQWEKTYICRLRLPFCNINHPRNYLTKLLTYPKVYDNINSLTCRFDFARACLDLFEKQAKYGTYHLTNPDAISTRAIVGMMQKTIARGRRFEWWDEEEFMRLAARTPKSNCLLNTSKLAAAGVRMRPVEEAVDWSIKNWTR